MCKSIWQYVYGFVTRSQSLISLPAHRGGHNSHGGWWDLPFGKGLQYCTVFFPLHVHSRHICTFPDRAEISESMGQRFFSQGLHTFRVKGGKPGVSATIAPFQAIELDMPRSMPPTPQLPLTSPTWR